ncbi:SpoIIE family protein phosphatase [candidate division KSB1 bacterium]
MEKINRKYFRFSLRAKITGLVLLVVVTIIATVSYYNISLDFKTRESDLQDGMQQIAKAIANVGSSMEANRGWNIYQDYIENVHQILDNIVYIAIFDLDGNLTAHVLNEELAQIPNEAEVSDSLMRDLVLRLDSRQILDLSLRDLGNVSEDIVFSEEVSGTVRLGYSKIELNTDIIAVRNRYIRILIIFILLGLFASLILSHRLTKPLTRLSAAMETVPHGKMDMLVETSTSDEIGSLAKSFNYMVKELREKEFFDNFERDLGKVFTLEKIFSTLLGRLERLYNINKGALFIKEKTTKGYKEIYQHNFPIDFPADFHKTFEYSLENHLKRDEVCFSLEGIKIIAQETPSLRPALSILENNQIHWIVFLQKQDSLIGVIYFGKDSREFTVDLDEKHYIVNLVSHTQLPLEVALLHAELTEQERLKKEFEIARNVQTSLLPQRKPEIYGYDIYGICLPAKEVGGDYFDFVEIDKNKIGVVIADVAGKSTSAAFYMAEIKGMIVSLCALYNSPRDLLKMLNSRLFLNSDRKVFASMIYGVLNTRTNEFVYARAGHNPLLFKKSDKNTIDTKVPDGLGLGLDRGDIFDSLICEDSIKLKNNDVVLLYTDGVVEAMNKQKEEFGEERLKKILLRQKDIPAEDSCRQILNEIKSYSNGIDQFDDITMLMISKKKT